MGLVMMRICVVLELMMKILMKMYSKLFKMRVMRHSTVLWIVDCIALCTESNFT